MPAYLTDSDAFFLHLIWVTSVLFAACATLIMMALILRRAWNMRIAAQRRLRSDFISNVLLATINAPAVPTADSLPELQKYDEAIVLRIALDLLRAVEGQDVVRIVEAIKAWGLMPYIRQRLGSSDRGRKIQALTLLMHFDDEESLSLLYKYAENDDIYVQLAALRGLATRGADEFLLHILSHLAHSKQHNTRLLADVLQRFGEPVVPILMVLAEQAPVEVRMASIIALSHIGSLTSVETLIALTRDALPDIRAQALTALAHLADRRAAPSIVRCLEDKEQAVRVHAAQAAGALGLTETLPRLIELLDNPTGLPSRSLRNQSASTQKGFGVTASACSASEGWWIRYRSAEAILHLGMASILKAKATQNDDAGIMAGTLLAERGVT